MKLMNEMYQPSPVGQRTPETRTVYADDLVRTPPPPERSNVVAGALWMVGVSLVLFFLPLVNGLIGGIVGGYKVGTFKRAMAAALLPAVVVGVGLWLLLAIFHLPVVGMVAGAAVGTWIVLADVGLFIGAGIGAALSPPSGRLKLS